jgi:hypothetical protein
VSRGFLIFFPAYNRVSPGFRLLFACSPEQAKPLNSHFSEAYKPTFAFVTPRRNTGKILPLPKMEPVCTESSPHPTYCGFHHGLRSPHSPNQVSHQPVEVSTFHPFGLSKHNSLVTDHIPL